MKIQKNSTKMLVLSGMFAAVLAVMSQLQIPMPSGVPLTLQTFAVALIGYVLGWKYGLISVGAWILLGTVGLPVFTQFQAGPGVLAGPTGGFILGFLAFAALCGYAYGKKRGLAAMLSVLGLVTCHAAGVLQFSFLMKTGVQEAFMVVSFPYLIKDVVSAAAAYAAAKAVRAGLAAAGMTTVFNV